jgi:hypothetical protein
MAEVQILELDEKPVKVSLGLSAMVTMQFLCGSVVS